MDRSRIKKLQPHHITAMEMRLSGSTFEEIGIKVGKTTNTVGSWFYDSDLFRDTFEQMKADCIERAKNILTNASADAANQLILMKNMKPGKGSHVALMAAKDILDRVGLSPASKSEVKLTGNMKNTHTIDEKLLENPEAVELMKQLFEKMDVDVNDDN